MRSVASIRSLLKEAENFLKAKGVPEPRADAEFLLSRSLGMSRLEIYLRSPKELSRKSSRLFRKWVRQRSLRIPLSYALGEHSFMGIPLRVGPGVFIPRPETENLVEAALRRLQGGKLQNPHLLDIGTGSGCIAVSLALRLPQSKISATDLSSESLRLARKNAVVHGVSSRIRFLERDLFPAGGVFDMILSNPPYVAREEARQLPPEIRREPRRAWDGGEGGLEILERIIKTSPRYLRTGGTLLLEIAPAQGGAVSRLLKKSGFVSVEVLPDDAGLERIAAGAHP